MLRLSASLRNQPVLSLRLGGPIATALEPIINPYNLKVIGWWCKTRNVNEKLILLADNVREFTPAGLAVNDEESLTTPNDLVRHQEILDIDFHLVDKPVKTKRQKLGKVSDFSYGDDWFVQKLYVARPLVKVFGADDTLIIDRTQIIEVTDHYILVRDAEVKASDEELAGAAVPA